LAARSPWVHAGIRPFDHLVPQAPASPGWRLVADGRRGVLNRYPLPADNPFVNQFFNLFFDALVKDDRFVCHAPMLAI
jgi:hypothetical protein